MVKYATRFQLAIYLQKGYKIVDWGMDQAGLYLAEPTYRTEWKGGHLLNPRVYQNTGTSLAASGTREELEELVAEFSK